MLAIIHIISPQNKSDNIVGKKTKKNKTEKHPKITKPYTKSQNISLRLSSKESKEPSLSVPQGLHLPRWVPYTFECESYCLLERFAFHPRHKHEEQSQVFSGL